MKSRIRRWMVLLTCFMLSPFAMSEQQKSAGTSPLKDPQQTNIQEYIELLRSNVRQEKAQVLGAVMQLSASDAAKFWPIYNEYDSELTRLNRMRSDNIQEYARSYDEMSDGKANELIMKSIGYQKQRLELLTKYYEKVRDAIGGINAARFVQIEHQLLLLIDLQIASNLPLAAGNPAASQGGSR